EDTEEITDDEDIDVIIKNRLHPVAKTEPQPVQRKESEIKIVGKINLEERSKKKKKEPADEEPEKIKAEPAEPVKPEEPIVVDESRKPPAEEKIKEEAENEPDI